MRNQLVYSFVCFAVSVAIKHNFGLNTWIAYELFSLLMLLQLFAIIYSMVRLSHDLKEYWQIRRKEELARCVAEKHTKPPIILPVISALRTELNAHGIHSCRAGPRLIQCC